MWLKKEKYSYFGYQESFEWLQVLRPSRPTAMRYYSHKYAVMRHFRSSIDPGNLHISRQNSGTQHDSRSLLSDRQGIVDFHGETSNHSRKFRGGEVFPRSLPELPYKCRTFVQPNHRTLGVVNNADDRRPARQCFPHFSEWSLLSALLFT